MVKAKVRTFLLIKLLDTNMNKYSVEWLYNECMNKNHALGITLKEPIMIDNKLYYEVTIVKFELSSEQKDVIFNNIVHGIDTFEGKYLCKGFLVQFGEHPMQDFYINLNDIEEVEMIK